MPKQRRPRKIQSQRNLEGKTVLLCVSGSIAAYRACDVVRQLRERGASVICLMTKAAQQFVTPLTFHALSGNPVHADPFSEHEDWNILHTTLADRADLILIAPATADMIARLAAGLADDLVTSVVLASRAQVLIAPAMNDNMFSHSLTQEHLQTLKRIGYQFVGPITGDLICGRTGVGHMAEPGEIIRSVEAVVRKT